MANWLSGSRPSAWADTAVLASECVCSTQAASWRPEWIAAWMTKAATFTAWGVSSSLRPSMSMRTRLEAVISPKSRP